MTRKQEIMAQAAGLHMASAVGALITLAIELGQDMAEVRAQIVEMTGELFDETVAEFKVED